jgi:5-carboxymethyl-2-hydroxymuconate isomerase
MKLLRYGPIGNERPAILDKDGRIHDLSGVIRDIEGSTLGPDSLERIRAVPIESLPIVDTSVRIGACVARPGKFVCIGLNYSDHARETGSEIPKEPVVFLKATTSLSGPYDPIVKPLGSTKLDWEVELAFVVGKECSYVDEAEAAKSIAGYCICNDVSERAFQMERGGLWDKGKGCDTFGPLGPWLVTPDEIADVAALSMWLDVNGKRYQNGSSETMIFKPAFILSYLSHFMRMEPGDVVTTGTPPGVGLGCKPPVYLDKGDVVQLGIAGLGAQKQVVMPYKAKSTGC